MHVHFSRSLSIFHFMSLNDAVCLCPKVLFGVRQPPKTPAYVLHNSSFTPPSSGQKLHFVFHNKSTCQVPRNLKSLGSFRGLGAFFFVVFCVNR